MPHAPVKPEELADPFTLKHLNFSTTAELDCLEAVLGQDRAMEALDFAAEIERLGYNLFVMGPEGTGKEAAVLAQLKKRAVKGNPSSDWVYVNNFESPHQPNAIALPAGRGQELAHAMDKFIEDIVETIPALLENEENQNRLRAIDEEYRNRPDETIEALRQRAAEKDIALMRTPMGFGFAPMENDEVIKPEDFAKLSQIEREKREAEIKEFQKELQEIVKQIPRWEHERREAIRDLQSKITASGISSALEIVQDQFRDLPEIQDYLREVREDLLENFHSIRASQQLAMQMPGRGALNAVHHLDGYGRYKVNPFVSQSNSSGAPIVREDNPSALNLIGRAEHAASYGALITDFSLLKAGALHRANGGYLVLDARKLLSQPFAWEALKRTIKSGQIVIESPGESLSLIATVSLKPEPITFNAKVVLIGERLLFYLLSDLDPEFLDLFKVVADFEADLTRTPETEEAFVQVIAGRIEEALLKPFTKTAVSEVLKRSARLAGDRTKLSIKMRGLIDLLSEADFLAAKEGKDTVDKEHVRLAVRAQERRLSRFKEKDLEAMEREIIHIETEGRKVGQVNALSVTELGGFSFGRPARVTARVRMGSGKVIDIEREVKLGGPLHSKGILILSGFLAGRYAIEKPLSLAATLVFEQSYGGIDGDSASSAELYALLSVLSEVPLRQDLAVTGSVDQQGRVQAIGGVNEKIEGFFELCRKRGLTGTQGVIIPSANLQHLVLHDDVLDCLRAGEFYLYAVKNVDEGISILTDHEAGERGADDVFTAKSINALVEARLKTFSSSREAYALGKDRIVEQISDGPVHE